MPTIVVNIHLRGFIIVEFLSNVGLVLRREPGPRFVSAPVIFVTRGYFNIVIELYYLNKKHCHKKVKKNLVFLCKKKYKNTRNTKWKITQKYKIEFILKVSSKNDTDCQRRKIMQKFFLFQYNLNIFVYNHEGGGEIRY